MHKNKTSTRQFDKIGLQNKSNGDLINMVFKKIDNYSTKNTTNDFTAPSLWQTKLNRDPRA